MKEKNYRGNCAACGRWSAVLAPQQPTTKLERYLGAWLAGVAVCIDCLPGAHEVGDDDEIHVLR